ncbi:hypothetical protein [Amycolatopsis australiensis]|uniref:hypothetical protein n=1 Tax=Amycolatopsis australiensis TaxID=546364 RepID=UPI001FECF1DE|nr:hypothetical protein [Amycolatopsis australiensis]
MASRTTSHSAMICARAQSRDGASQPLVGHAEGFAVAVFEVDRFAEIGVDPVEVVRVDRQPPFVLFAGTPDDAEAELVHGGPFARTPF